MKYKSIKRITMYVLFMYIVIFLTATSTILNRIGLVLVAGSGGLYFLLNEFKIKKNTFLIGMFLYGTMIYLAKMYSPAPIVKVDAVFNGYISMFIVIFVTTLVADTENDIKFLLKAFAIASLVQCIYMLSVYGTDIFRTIAKNEEAVRIGDEVSNSNSVGISFALSYIISLHFFLNEKMPIYKKVFYGLLIVIGFVFGLLSASRKALLLLVVGSFVILFLGNVSAKNAIKTFFGILAACVAVYVMYDLISTNSLFSTVNDRFTSLIEGLQGKAKFDHSSETRFYMIRAGWDAFKESPVVGKGLYSSYIYFGTYSHNNFIEILMNTGIIGFVIFYFPYLIELIGFIKIDKTDKLYPVMLIFFLWILLGAYGMITYYAKDSMTLMALVSVWLSMQRSKKNEKSTY